MIIFSRNMLYHHDTDADPARDYEERRRILHIKIK